MRRRARDLLVNVLLCLLSSGFSFAVLELALRIHNPLHSRLNGHQIKLRTNYTQEYLLDYPTFDHQITVHKNSLGFRGPDPPVNVRDYFSLIAIGGSTTECILLTDGKTWVDRLDALVHKSIAKAWLNNAGLDGHSTFGHLVLLNDYIVKIKPKVALFLVGVNDVARENPFPGFDDANMGIIRTSSLKSFLKSLTEHSEVLAALNAVYSYSRVLLFGAKNVHDVTFNLPSMGQLQISADDIAAQKLLHSQRYIPLYRRRLVSLVESCLRDGIQPVLMTQPYLLGEGIDDITKVNLATVQTGLGQNGRLEWEVLELYNDATRSVAAERHVLLIDLAKQMPKSSRYFYDVCHFTNEGAYKIAQLVFDGLQPILAIEQRRMETPPRRDDSRGPTGRSASQ